MKYYMMSKTQAQELKKEQLIELFHFAIIPFWTTEAPGAATISDSSKENVAQAVSNTSNLTPTVKGSRFHKLAEMLEYLSHTSVISGLRLLKICSFIFNSLFYFL